MPPQLGAQTLKTGEFSNGTFGGDTSGTNSQRRLSVYPDKFGMEQDICDVTLWLIEKHSRPGVHVWVDRQYTQIRREIASVTVMTSPKHTARLTDAAHGAFLALGYTIEDTSADIYGHQFCDGRHARHEDIHAYELMQGALPCWRSP